MASITVTQTSFEIPIESVQLGSRINTKNPVPEDYDHSLPEPEQYSWAKISLLIERINGSITQMELLRPISWIRAHRLQAGADLALHLPELEFTGNGRVTAIEHCPAIAKGDGSVVTGRIVTYNAHQLIEITFEGEVTLIGTLQHPVWSVDRFDWVGLGDLEAGEQVAARDGVAIVQQLRVIETNQPVYNLETHGEHVYEVTELGLLVHNTDPKCARYTELNEIRKKRELNEAEKKEFEQLADELKRNDKSGFKIVEQDGSTVELKAQTTTGEVIVLSDMIKVGNDLYLKGLHIDGPGAGTLGTAELIRLIKEFGKAQNVKRVIIEGMKLTTGANPGHVPRIISIDIE